MESNTGNARERGNSISKMSGNLAPDHPKAISAPSVQKVEPTTTTELPQHAAAYNLQSVTMPAMDVEAPADPPTPMDPRTLQPEPRRHHRLPSRDCGCVRRILEPPVTKATLSELDVVRIVYNPKLRHDVNFDPDLCFRPNTDGEKGKKKLVKASEFWDVMQRQLAACMADPAAFAREHPKNDWCLPAALNSAREIIETLVPARDRIAVNQILDIDLIMQEFRMGAVKLVRLATWIAELLKTHCAPMRDGDVDDMAAIFCDGERSMTPAALTRGVSRLLSVLEHMKLDIANHQIRCLRPLLINDTVAFEHKLFIKKIATGKVNAPAAHHWFRHATAACKDAASSPPEHNGTQWDFMLVLLSMLTPLQNDVPWPATFTLDEDRLIRLRFDINDLINLQVGMVLFQTLDKQARIRNHQRLVQEQSILISHVSVQDGRNDAIPSGATHRTLSGTTAGPAPVPRLGNSSHQDLQRLRSAMQAIVSNTPGPSSERWTAAAPALALQLLRSTSMPMSMLAQLESRLVVHLSNRESAVYTQAKTHVMTALTAAVRTRSAAFEGLDAVKIYEKAMHPDCLMKRAPSATVPSAGEAHDVSRIATRIAHIGTLHWRTWANLTYLVDPEMVSDGGSGSGSSGGESDTDSSSEAS